MQKRSRAMGDLIRSERKKRKLTLSDLAHKLDISTTYLGLLEMGKRGKNINLDLLVKIGYVFGVSTDYLLGLESDEKYEEKQKEYETMLTLYRLMDEKQREKILDIAQVLLK